MLSSLASFFTISEESSNKMIPDIRYLGSRYCTQFSDLDITFFIFPDVIYFGQTRTKMLLDGVKMTVESLSHSEQTLLLNS